MSNADISLMSTFMQDGFKGRPMDVEYVIRVWDLDDVQFSAIEDVQFVLQYTYWTRQN